jgi:hypothetical protein
MADTPLRDIILLEEVQLESDLTYEENPSKSWRHQKELLEPRLSNFARFSGVTTQRKKQLGNEKMNSEKATRTYLLANLNLEGEIYLKGFRLVTSQKFG